MSALSDPVADPGLGRAPLQSFMSVSSGELRTLTTCNCELALLPLGQLLELQPSYLRLEEDPGGLECCHPGGGGYNLFSDGSVCMDGRQYRVANYISREALIAFIIASCHVQFPPNWKVDLASHFDYKDYRETLLARPMLFLTTARKGYSLKETTFAFIVNTRHPKVRAQLEGGMDRVISSVVGESYKLQFDFQNVVKSFLAKEGFMMQGDGLSFTYEFKADALFDFFYMFGFSKKTVPVKGRVMNLFSNNPEKKEVVKMFLSKMSEPYVRLCSRSDRRLSFVSMSSLDEDAFRSHRPSMDDSPGVMLVETDDE